MGIVDRLNNFLRPKETFNLAKAPIYSIPDPLALKTSPTITRILPEYLEQIYYSDGLVFQTINKLTQIIMSKPYKLDGDPESVKFFDDFFNMIGYRGGEDDWRTLLTKIFKYQYIYGWAPVELIYNKSNDEILDLEIIDPKKFDYAKTSANKIALDKFGNPLGYVETLPGFESFNQKIQPPPEVTLMGNQIYFPSDRVALFKLHTFGDGFYPIGTIEPIYEICIQDKAAREGFANYNYHTGRPIMIGKIGDTMHEPTEERLVRAKEELQEINSKSVLVFPYYDNISILEPKSTKDIKSVLEYYADAKLDGLGVPKAIVTASGEDVNRSTLQTQVYMLKLGLKETITATSSIIECKIMKRIADLHNLKYGTNIKVPKIVWGEISIEELDSMAVRLERYIKSQVLKPSESLTKWIKNIENIPDENENGENENEVLNRQV